jgi:hypothetical protein
LRLERGRRFGDVWLGYHQHVFRGGSGGQPAGATRLLARSPARLQAGADRSGSDAGRLSAGI